MEVVGLYNLTANHILNTLSRTCLGSLAKQLSNSGYLMLKSLVILLIINLEVLSPLFYHIYFYVSYFCAILLMLLLAILTLGLVHIPMEK